MSKIKYFIQESWLLLLCAFCFGLVLAAANAAWSGRIKQNEDNKIKDLMANLLPSAKNLRLVLDVEVSSDRGKKVTTPVFKAVADDESCVGWSFKVRGSGFAGKIELIVAVDADFEKMAGYNILYAAETPGFGDRIKEPYFRNQFVGAPAGQLTLVATGEPQKIDAEIVAITGATVSSTAVVDALNVYLERIKPALREKGLLKNAG